MFSLQFIWRSEHRSLLWLLAILSRKSYSIIIIQIHSPTCKLQRGVMLPSTRPLQPGIKMSSSILKPKHHSSQNPYLLSGSYYPQTYKMSVSSSLSLVLISLTIIGKSDHVLLRPDVTWHLGNKYGHCSLAGTIAGAGWGVGVKWNWIVNLSIFFPYIFQSYISHTMTLLILHWARVCLIHKSLRR